MSAYTQKIEKQKRETAIMVQQWLGAGLLAGLDTLANVPHLSAFDEGAGPLGAIVDGAVTGLAFTALCHAAGYIAEKLPDPFQQVKMYFLATMLTIGVHESIQDFVKNTSERQVKTHSTAQSALGKSSGSALALVHNQ
jgi:hypothetical protein